MLGVLQRRTRKRDWAVVAHPLVPADVGRYPTDCHIPQPLPLERTMKTTAIACVLMLASTLAYTAQSDEPDVSTSTLSYNTSEIGKQLLDILALSYEQRMVEYRDGRSTPGRLIELNRELFDEQISAVNSGQRKLVAERFLARAQAIEDVANSRLANGVGVSMDVLDAKAARLRATIELAIISDFTN